LRVYRRKFYNLFSKIYDSFVNLHSKNSGHEARKALAALIEPQRDKVVVDICTGTGSLLAYLADRSNVSLTIGIDFSRGMLKKAKEKIKDKNNIYLIEADVTRLPLRNAKCNKIFCSHAFYEVKDKDQVNLLNEVKRTLKPSGHFIMMEHEIPENMFIRFLFYLRILSMGIKAALNILKREEIYLKSYFSKVRKTYTSSKKSKIYICEK
jgi:ubiquinone/menaquinone biosynthesis C-methylase UbiE